MARSPLRERAHGSSSGTAAPPQFSLPPTCRTFKLPVLGSYSRTGLVAGNVSTLRDAPDMHLPIVITRRVRARAACERRRAREPTLRCDEIARRRLVRTSTAAGHLLVRPHARRTRPAMLPPGGSRTPPAKVPGPTPPQEPHVQ